MISELDSTRTDDLGWLSKDDRIRINKRLAHLTWQRTEEGYLDDDFDLSAIALSVFEKSFQFLKEQIDGRSLGSGFHFQRQNHRAYWESLRDMAEALQQH